MLVDAIKNANYAKDIFSELKDSFGNQIIDIVVEPIICDLQQLDYQEHECVKKENELRERIQQSLEMGNHLYE